MNWLYQKTYIKTLDNFAIVKQPHKINKMKFFTALKKHVALKTRYIVNNNELGRVFKPTYAFDENYL